MPRFVSALAASALAAGAIVTSATSAHATGIANCREVSQGGTSLVVVCYLVEANESVSTSGATVAPSVAFNCSVASKPTCYEVFTVQRVDIGTTGFIANPEFTPPLIDIPSGTVKVYEGTIGSIWINGTEYPVTVDEFCVGDPTIC